VWSQYTFLLRNAKTQVFGIQSWVVVNPRSCPLLFLYSQAAILVYFAAHISWINIITLSSYSLRTCSVGKVQCSSSILTLRMYLCNVGRERRVFAWWGRQILPVLPLPLPLSFLTPQVSRYGERTVFPRNVTWLCSSGEIAMLHSYALMHCITVLSFVIIILLMCIAIC